ncbi:MAG: radical SAM protein [Candidatus Omnitrophica bacterium]|nr:radical SAM protein [Candidatus Omnitrophota bacterium]MDD5774614.1 radical SAM protein [Candidatus Omnitrophota bacterium]
MKILFIDPPPYGFDRGREMSMTFNSAANKIPSLGLGYLAATARSSGHEASIFDCTVNNDEAALYSAAASCKPDVIGITSTTPVFVQARSIAESLRKIHPAAVYVLGGSHATCDPAGALAAGAFDLLVMGEGEDTFAELLSCLEKGRRPDETVKGIAFRNDSSVVVTTPRGYIDDLDRIPLPARDLLPGLRAYHPTPASYRRLPVGIVMTSRGCPSRCTFCDRAIFGSSFRKRSADNVGTELDELVNKYGAKEVRFFDDTFTVDRGHASSICALMRTRFLDIPWTCLTRVTAVTPEMLRELKMSGCWQVLYGLESGDDGILEKLGKGNTVEQNRRAVYWAKKAGLKIRADFLVGSPWETKATFRKTVEFAKSLPLDFAHFNKFVPYPGTDIYKNLTAQGYSFDFYRGSFSTDHESYAYVPPAFSCEDYGAALNKAFREFYLRPGYLIHKILSMKTRTEFAGHVKGMSSILALRER